MTQPNNLPTPAKQEDQKLSPPPRGYFDGEIPVVIIKRKNDSTNN
jgi:hypothetical protein